MLFNSYVFILLFLPCCLAGYFLLNRWKKEAANLFLLGMSLWFYGYLNPKYLFVIGLSILANFFLCKGMARISGQGLKKAIMIAGVVMNLGILGYYKYTDFLIENINTVFSSHFRLLHLVLPLGISFFTFQQISYLLDSFGGRVKKTDLVTYACYVSFFPQLVAGPIVTQEEFLPQFTDPKLRRLNWENMAKGIYIFVMGLAKKVLLADTFGQAVTAGYSVIPNLNSVSALFLSFAYTIQLYFDFSGYCDMAIGIGKMFNIELPMNFMSPYQGKSIHDIWRRWHITLTRFFTKYVYIPLGGNRKGNVRKQINVMIVFLLSGLWHGANWTFVVWGLCHGTMMVLTGLFETALKKLPDWIRGAFAVLFFNFTWVIFRAPTFREAFELFGRMLHGGLGRLPNYFTACFMPKALEALVTRLPFGNMLPDAMTVIYFVIACLIIFCVPNVHEIVKRGNFTWKRAVYAAILLVCCVISFEKVSVFLYFNF